MCSVYLQNCDASNSFAMSAIGQPLRGSDTQQSAHCGSEQ